MKKIIIAALSILFALVPAIASADGRWQWDMSLEDVAKALGVSAASATRVEDSMQLKGPYTSDGRHFEGTFTFEHSKLRGVSLTAVDPTDCLAFDRSLEKGYGKPDTEKETPGVMTVMTWHTAKDQIVWMRVGSASQSTSCVVVYSPRARVVHSTASMISASAICCEGKRGKEERHESMEGIVVRGGGRDGGRIRRRRGRQAATA